MSIKDTIEIAITQRPKFGEAIGYSSDSKLNTKDIPQLLSSIYAQANGTHHSIDDQSLMDIVPGFRLIHRDELKNEIISFSKTYSDLNDHIPFLGDYASSYYSLNINDGSIYRVSLDSEPSKFSNSLEIFWQTVLCFYKERAYFLDSDGFLDYDFDKEGIIGTRLNHNCSYWKE